MKKTSGNPAAGRPEGKYAWTVKVGEKGQFVIPKEAREIFHIQPGDTLLLLGDIHQGLAIPQKTMFTSLIDQIFPQNGEKQDSGEEEGEA